MRVVSALSRTRSEVRLVLAAALALTITALAAKPAAAVPAFAVQTGQPCQACHVGGFGPQLTPAGRAFKLHGYTTRMGGFNVPLSAMAVASYVNTRKDQDPPPAPGFNGNNNVAIDQVSLFLAGGFGQHLGAFFQATWDGIAHKFAWDNLDVRAVTNLDIKGADVLLGASLNNSPTVSDAWNTTPAWGFPYTGSDLAPSPSASPLISDALAQNTLGLTGYALINQAWYVEGGAYWSPKAVTLDRLGVDPTDPGSIHGLAPYGRFAWQHNFGKHAFEAGAFGMHSEIYPGRDKSTGETDNYTDLGLDVSDQYVRDNSDVITFNARYIHERQKLKATFLLGGADHEKNTLQDIRADVSYYWRNKVGATIQAFDTWGSADEILMADNRTFKPDSNGVMLQLDGTPWGDGKGPLGPRFNMRVGVQYTLYGKYNGARSDFDGAGANASDNDTLRVFTWLAF